MVTLYTPPFDHQGTAYNCGVSSTGMLVSRDWLGTKVGSESAIRSWIDSNRGRSASEGTSHADGIAAAKALYDTDLVYRYAMPWADFVAPFNVTAYYDTDLNHGLGAMVSILYSAVPSAYKSSSFTGRHRIVLNTRRYNTSKLLYEFQVADPLAAGWVWWPEWAVRQAMEASGTLEASYARSITSPVKKVLCSPSYLQDAAKIGGESTKIAQGKYVSVKNSIIGASYSTLCCGNAASNVWFELTGVETGDTVPPTIGAVASYFAPASGKVFIKKTRVTF